MTCQRSASPNCRRAREGVAAIAGLPDHEPGKVPVAFVVPTSVGSFDETAALKLFEGRLAAYKQPRRIVFVDQLRRTPIGKVKKKALRALTRSRFLAEAALA